MTNPETNPAVEAVARAIALAHFTRGYIHNTERQNLELVERYWRTWTGEAIAAIKALRDNIPDGMKYAEFYSDIVIQNIHPVLAFKAMINAALPKENSDD